MHSQLSLLAISAALAIGAVAAPAPNGIIAILIG